MGEEYLPSFTKNLNNNCLLDVCMAEDGMLVAPAKVYVCSGLCTFNHNLIFSINTTTYHHFNPEINTLFKSAVGFVESYDVMSIILTRIGEDGAEGSLILSK